MPNKEIEVGKKIKISNGKPFAGHEGFVVEQYGKKRFGVLLLPLQILVITDIDTLEEIV